MEAARLAMLTAMSLEPSDEYVDIIESIYETTEEQHDCHLVENIRQVEVCVKVKFNNSFIIKLSNGELITVTPV